MVGTKELRLPDYQVKGRRLSETGLVKKDLGENMKPVFSNKKG